MLKRILLLAIATLFAAPAAYGQTDPCDTNLDGTVDVFESDQCNPPAETLDDWLSGPDAADLNGDGFVDGADYDLFFGFGPEQTLEEWLAGPEAHDANGDGFIDGADYDLVFFGPGISLDDWLAGPDAEDVNGDGFIDEVDYEEFFGFGPGKPPFEEWLASDEAFDVNGDARPGSGPKSKNSS
jgi:hypothetical protein